MGEGEGMGVVRCESYPDSWEPPDVLFSGCWGKYDYDETFYIIRGHNPKGWAS